MSGWADTEDCVCSLHVFVKTVVLPERVMGVLSLLAVTKAVRRVLGPLRWCQSGPGVVHSPGAVPAGFFAACMLLALVVTLQCAQTHIFGSSARHGFCAAALTPACPSFL